ncbi:MAG: FAD-dependent oxidoreductase [Sandaracinaceae bacterium]|nr:FAD-dependent oxidoreductase [Sandaracinaceae bacterium]
MARTPSFDLLRRAARLFRSAERAGEPVREHAERLRAQYLAARLDRRAFLRATGGAAAFAAFPLALSGCESGGGARVGIVGAGLAGLHCAHRLIAAGVDTRVFEAWNRTGGRTFTARGMLAGDQLVELGGELIDSGHETMRALAEELELTLDDLAEPSGVRAETFYFGGSVLSEADVIEAFETVAPALATAFTAAEEDDAEFERLDNLSIPEFLESSGASDLIQRILEVAYVGEYGLEADEQSILNVVYLIDAETTDPFRIFGDSDERYHLHEGSEAIAQALTARHASHIELEHRLVAIRRAGERIRLTFDVAGGGSVDEDFDHVVLTLPFTQLRTVAIEEGLFPEDKLEVIRELAYGTNAKLMMQFERKPWREDHSAGGAGFADNGTETFWETSRGQAGTQGILTHYTGGRAGVMLSTGTPVERAQAVLPAFDAIFPGTQAAFNGMAVRMHWPSAPFHGGSYVCYRPGQWAYYGLEGRREGRVHFAGEHTSLEFQGYMEGAAETGARAAMDILVDLGLATGAPLVRAPSRRRAWLR